MAAFTLHNGDCKSVMKTLPDNSIGSIVTDPPYGLSKDPDIEEVLRNWEARTAYDHGASGFMGKAWDSFVPNPDVWDEAYRILKPGGYLLAFAGTRTQGLMATSIEMAGFKIARQLSWVYGCLPMNYEVLAKINHQEPLWMSGEDLVSLMKSGTPVVEILQYEPRSNTYGFAAVSDYYHGEYPFPMVSITAYPKNGWKNCSHEVTASHRVLVRDSEGIVKSKFAHEVSHEDEIPAYIGEETVWVEIQSVGKGSTPGHVWCVTTATGYFVARSGEDSVPFVTGNSGFPKSLDISKAIDSMKGADREVVGVSPWTNAKMDSGKGVSGLRQVGSHSGDYNDERVELPITAPASEEAKKWSGWGTALKPAFEPIIVAMKPYEDGSYPTVHDSWQAFLYTAKASRSEREEGLQEHDTGIVDPSRKPGSAGRQNPRAGAGRSGEERANIHPTVKPVAIMEWLVSLEGIAEPILDPFTGSGTTGKACGNANKEFVGIEMTPEYVEIARRRIQYAYDTFQEPQEEWNPFGI